MRAAHLLRKNLNEMFFALGAFFNHEMGVILKLRFVGGRT